MCMTCVRHAYDMCLSGSRLQLLYLNPVGHVAVSLYIREIAAQDRAPCLCTFHLVSHEWLAHRLVSHMFLLCRWSWSHTGLLAHDGHFEGHRPIPKDRSYMQFSWVCLVGVGVS